jgi:hypothetical protein
MSNLQDVVWQVVQDLMDGDELFTALDVSNRVKGLLPYATHREVRTEVRGLYLDKIEPQGWVRTPITVMLADGTPQQALLYHPLHTAWDLDNKYDQQKRSQVAFDPAKAAATAVAANSNSMTTSTPVPPSPSATITVSATTPVPMPTARDLWKQLFATQPSLFPTK